MLVYDQPIDQARSDARRRPVQSAAGFTMLELTRLLWGRKAAIAIAGLICACAAVMIGKSLTPKFTATAQLYVDPRELQLVDRDLTPRAQDTSDLAMVVESQARLITSNNVLLQLIGKTNLDQDPEFGGESRGMLASLQGLFGIESRSAGEVNQGQMAALEILNRHINVKKTDRSFIVDIEVWSYDPAKAAMLANAIANAYLAESKMSKSEAARRATSDLSGRLKELQERLRNAENALAIYKAQNNFVGTQDTLISDQQLSASSQRLATVRALTLDAQAKYDQIDASRRASSDAGAIPEALQSPTVANLRAQYAETRKRYAELKSELGPRHPALRQIEKQVEDLRTTVDEEVDRFAQAAKNDLARARDYEVSLSKALEAQKRQSVELSHASVRLRELEREVEASRDVYQSFLKRSRETEEQESLNTSSARIIGEALVPRRRTFPPAISMLALVGFMLGTLGAIGWFVAADRLIADATALRPRAPTWPEAGIEVPSRQPLGIQPQQRPAVALIEKPPIIRLQDSDVMWTLSGILKNGGVADITQWGWPTLRAGYAPTAFLNAMGELRAAVVKRSLADAIPVMAVIGAGDSKHRSIAALNIALAAARDGAKVLMIDADHAQQALSSKINGLDRAKASRLGWLNVGTKSSRVIETTNGISILPAIRGGEGRASHAVRKAIAKARFAGSYDLVILDGPALPWSAAERKMLDDADGLAAVLPVSIDINDSMNDSMEEIIAALGGAECKLVAVVVSELHLAAENLNRNRQYV